MGLRFRTNHQGLVIATASSGRQLAQAFIRIQEFYESPDERFRGKRFSKLAYERAYRRATGGRSYYSDWDGFNIPGYYLSQFRLTFPKLNKAEAEIFAALDTIDRRLPDLYLIGTVENDEQTLKHEIAHARYYRLSSYVQDVNEALGSFALKHPYKWIRLTEHLRGLTYPEFRLVDEAHAYVLFEQEHLVQHGFDFSFNSPLKLLQVRLDQIFNMRIYDGPFAELTWK